MFQSGSIIDDHEEALDLDLNGGDALPDADSRQAESHLPEHIFRAYDIRGNAETELTEDQRLYVEIFQQGAGGFHFMDPSRCMLV